MVSTAPYRSASTRLSRLVRPKLNRHCKAKLIPIFPFNGPWRFVPRQSLFCAFSTAMNMLRHPAQIAHTDTISHSKCSQSMLLPCVLVYSTSHASPPPSYSMNVQRDFNANNRVIARQPLFGCQKNLTSFCLFSYTSAIPARTTR